MSTGRRSLTRGAVIAIVMALVACGRTRHPRETTALPDDYAAQVQGRRDQHEADYRRDFVTIAGLHVLEPGTHLVGSGPANDIVLKAPLPAVAGRLTVETDRVLFDPAPGVTVVRNGQPALAPIMLKDTGARPLEPIAIGQVTLAVHLTGGRLALRVRDPQGAPARSFAGFTWFPIDTAHRVTGRFIRDAAARRLPVMNTLNGVDTYDTEGVVEFELQGQAVRLRPFTTRPGRLYFVFRDASSGGETYKVARFLYAGLQEDSRVILDFNQAYNPPCAFNQHTTCPIPLKENVLPVKVLAGEKAYAKPSASAGGTSMCGETPVPSQSGVRQRVDGRAHRDADDEPSGRILVIAPDGEGAVNSLLRR